MSPSNRRETFGSRLGLVATMIGVAVGLGNVWRFPYMAGQFGGASFVLFYVLAVALIGIPALIAEWILGRHTRRGPVGAFDAHPARRPDVDRMTGAGLVGDGEEQGSCPLEIPGMEGELAFEGVHRTADDGGDDALAAARSEAGGEIRLTAAHLGERPAGIGGAAEAEQGLSPQRGRQRACGLGVALAAAAGGVQGFLEAFPEQQVPDPVQAVEPCPAPGIIEVERVAEELFGARDHRV